MEIQADINKAIRISVANSIRGKLNECSDNSKALKKHIKRSVLEGNPDFVSAKVIQIKQNLDEAVALGKEYLKYL